MIFPDKMLLSRRDLLTLAAAGALQLVPAVSQAQGGERSSLYDPGDPPWDPSYKRRRWVNKTAPSAFAAHVFRLYPDIPDISLERIRLIGVAYWPKDETGATPQQARIQAPSEQALNRVSRFWERELAYRTVIRNEFLPQLFQGTKFADEIIFQDVLRDLKTGFREKIQDQSLRERLIKLIDSHYTSAYEPSSGEFLALSVKIMHGSWYSGRRRYRYYGSGRKGISHLGVDVDDVDKGSYVVNYETHELGHAFGLPDQYSYIPPDPPNEWYDPDPKNIMGDGAMGYPIEEMHLATSTKIWMLNSNYRKHFGTITR